MRKKRRQKEKKRTNNTCIIIFHLNVASDSIIKIGSLRLFSSVNLVLQIFYETPCRFFEFENFLLSKFSNGILEPNYSIHELSFKRKDSTESFTSFILLMFKFIKIVLIFFFFHYPKVLCIFQYTSFFIKLDRMFNNCSIQKNSPNFFLLPTCIFYLPLIFKFDQYLF